MAKKKPRALSTKKVAPVKSCQCEENKARAHEALSLLNRAQETNFMDKPAKLLTQGQVDRIAGLLRAIQ